MFKLWAYVLQANAGINVRKGQITNILEENVVQPLLVSTSALSLATECVRMILKIDDIVSTRWKLQSAAFDDCWLPDGWQLEGA